MIHWPNIYDCWGFFPSGWTTVAIKSPLWHPTAYYRQMRIIWSQHTKTEIKQIKILHEYICLYKCNMNKLSLIWFFLMYGLLYKFPQCFCSAKLSTISGHPSARDHQLWRIGGSNERYQGGQVRIHMLTLFGQCDTCQQPAKQPKVRWKVLPLFFFSVWERTKKDWLVSWCWFEVSWCWFEVADLKHIMVVLLKFQTKHSEHVGWP